MESCTARIPTKSIPHVEGTGDQCPHCGATAGFDLREKVPHVGLWCRACGRWLKWLPKGHAVIMPFGKYRGQSVENLPHEYAAWMIHNVNVKGSLKIALKAVAEGAR